MNILNKKLAFRAQQISDYWDA